MRAWVSHRQLFTSRHTAFSLTGLARKVTSAAAFDKHFFTPFLLLLCATEGRLKKKNISVTCIHP